MTPLLAQRVSVDPGRSFERLYRRHVRDVYVFALGVLGNPSDAEDVTQTTFLNAYRAVARGERVENPRGWLLAIAQNVCRQRFRTAARRPQEVELDPEVMEAFVDEDAPGADEIRAAMLHLSFNQRTVLVLREIEGRSYAEIAEAMGASVSAVETLLFRARRALREQLEAAERPLSCGGAELFISRQLDGRLSRHERGMLRAHLRACPACAAYARRQRAQKKALGSLGALPLPAGIAGVLGWSLGGSAAAKAAAVVASAALIGSGVAVGTGVVPPPWPTGTPPAHVDKAEVSPHVGKPALSELASSTVRPAPASSAVRPAPAVPVPPGLQAKEKWADGDKPGMGPWANPGQGPKASKAVDSAGGKPAVDSAGGKPADVPGTGRPAWARALSLPDQAGATERPERGTLPSRRGAPAEPLRGGEPALVERGNALSAAKRTIPSPTPERKQLKGVKKAHPPVLPLPLAG